VTPARSDRGDGARGDERVPSKDYARQYRPQLRAVLA
jgi:hypothetical protein